MQNQSGNARCPHTARLGAQLILALSLCPALAHADDDGKPEWTLGGFGTLGLAHSDERNANFTANVLNPGAAGLSHPWSPEVDSRLGVQLGVNIAPRWSAVLQLVSERDLAHSYAPAVEWANIQYQATPDLSLRLGRIALPIFLAGDYRKAGYALPWVRPPVELYGALPVSNSDGIDASVRWNVGDLKNITQVFFGHADVKVSDTSRAKARTLSGISNGATYGALSVRASALTTELTVDVARPLFDAFRQFGPAGAALAEQYDIDRKRTSVIALGFNYDPGDWFLMGEAARMNTHSYLGSKRVLYLSSGYRIGDVTPYVAYSQSRPDSTLPEPGLSVTGMPLPAAATAAALNGALSGLLSAIAIQHTVTLGARWDLKPNYALKLQYDRLRPQGGSSGTLINVQPGFQSGHPVNVMSAVLDFVF